MGLVIWLSPLVCTAGIMAGAETKVVKARAGEVATTKPVVKRISHEVVVDDCGSCDEVVAEKRGLFKLVGHGKAVGDPCDPCDPCADADPCGGCGCYCPKRPGILHAIGRFLFGRRKCCCTCCCCGSGSLATAVVEEKPAPVVEPPKTETVKYEPKPVEKPIEKPVEKPIQKAVYKPQLGHADDYSWVQGRLEYAHVNGGAWIIRYGTLEHDDKYGGSVVLARDARYDGFKEGDIVRAEGDLIADKASILLYGGPLYRSRTVNLVMSGPAPMFR